MQCVEKLSNEDWIKKVFIPKNEIPKHYLNANTMQSPHIHLL